MNQNKYLINPDAPVAEISEVYPEVAEYLVSEYGFHCTNCFLSEFETLREGAEVHGIFDEDFEILLKEINEMASEIKKSHKD